MEDKTINHTDGSGYNHGKFYPVLTIENCGVYFQRGYETALGFVYLQLHPVLSLYANRWVNDRSIAEDIASEAFICTWKFHAKLDSYNAIKAYLYTATMRLSQRYANKEYKRSKIHKEVFSLVEDGGTAYDNIVRAETYQLLRSSIDALPEGSRKVITMQFLEGKSTKEIAAELNLSPSTIKTQKTQGLAALRKKMIRPLLLLLSLQLFFAPL